MTDNNDDDEFVFGGSYWAFRYEACAHDGCPDGGETLQQKGQMCYFDDEVTFEFECIGCGRDNVFDLKLVDYDPTNAIDTDD